MKKHWGMFHFVTEHLKELYRRHADAGARGLSIPSTVSGQKPQEGIFQYGDWFDRYPHGVTGTDYEDPVQEIKKEPGSDAVLGQKGDLQSVEEFFAKMSPPSRAAQAKKAARKKRTKSAGQTTSTPVDPAATQPTPFSQPSNQHQHVHIPHMDQSMMNTNYTQHIPYNQQPSGQQYPQDMSHDMALLQAQQRNQHVHLQHPGIMSHLDRQMVLSSYAGMEHHTSSPTDPTHHNHSQQQHLQHLDSHSTHPQSHHGFNDYDMNANPFGFNADGVWDQTSAWFMPFNVDPPTMGDDAGLFAQGGYADFTAGLNMAGFGMGGIDLESEGPVGQGQGGGGGGAGQGHEGMMD